MISALTSFVGCSVTVFDGIRDGTDGAGSFVGGFVAAFDGAREGTADACSDGRTLGTPVDKLEGASVGSPEVGSLEDGCIGDEIGFLVGGRVTTVSRRSIASLLCPEGSIVGSFEGERVGFWQ